MRLLVLAPRFPWPPDKGDRLTIYHYLRYLSQRHEVTLATFLDRNARLHLDKVRPLLAHLVTVPQSLAWSVLRTGLALPTSLPLQVAYYRSAAMRQALRRHVAEHRPDVVYVHTLRMAQHAADLAGIPKVLALQISMSLNYRRLTQYSASLIERSFYALERTRVAEYEYNICRDFEKVVLISKADLDEVTRGGKRPLDNVHLLPHGVDHEFFRPDPDVAPDPGSIIMTGNMAYPPNKDAVQWFVEEILPKVQARRPDVKLWIVGKNPPPAMRALADGERVMVTGEVEDLRPYLAGACVGVVPTRIAAGLQNKLLEGMAMALPMVATPNANEGIRAKDGEELLLAETPEAFADAVLSFLADAEKRRVFGLAARRFIEERFTWEFFLRDLEQVMDGLVP